MTTTTPTILNNSWESIVLLAMFYCAIGISLFYYTIRLWSRRQQSRSVVASSTAPSFSSPPQHPHVTIQICTSHHESSSSSSLVQETIRRACMVDWPSVAIQVVLDEAKNTNNGAVLEDAVAAWSAEGIDICCLTRKGDLQYHLRHSVSAHSQFVAMFVRNE